MSWAAISTEGRIQSGFWNDFENIVYKQVREYDNTRTGREAGESDLLKYDCVSFQELVFSRDF